ncbi:MAG TPA: AsmA family protein [candidate division Zixibacteria bacterium]|nr:AsmA family protein [candidate division Zixibacteria bacterium]
MKLLKILAWLAGIVMALFLLAFLALKIFLPADKIKAMAIEEGEAKLGRQIKIDGIDVSLWGGLGIKLEGVFVSNPPDMEDGNFLAADNIDVKLQLLPLITGDLAVDRLIVNGPRISMTKQADGTNNYTFATVDENAPTEAVKDVPAEAKTAMAAVTFDKLQIEDGAVEYRDDSSGVAARLLGLGLETSLTTPREGIYQSSGKLRIDSLYFTSGETYGGFQVGLDYKAEYDFRHQSIAVDETELTINGLAFDLTGRVDLGGEALSANGNIKSRAIDVADLFNLMPAGQTELLEGIDLTGQFTLDADVKYDGAVEDGLSYSGTATIGRTTMKMADIPGVLKLEKALVDFEPDNLRMNIEDGTFDGEPLKGYVIVDHFDNPAINGELAGRLNLAFVQPFLPADQNTDLSGNMSFSAKFAGLVEKPEQLEFSGNIKIDSGKYNSTVIPEPIQNFRLDAYFDNSLTRVNDFVANMPSGKVSFSGRINNLIPYLMADSAAAANVVPSVDGKIAGKLALGLVAPFLPQAGKPEVGGTAEFDIKLAGDASKQSNFKPQGSLAVRDAFYRDSLLPEPVEHFSTEMRITPDTIDIQSFEVQFVSSDISLKGKLSDPFPYLLPLDVVDRSKVKKPLFVFVLESGRFDFDRMFPEAVPGSGTNRSTLPVDSTPPLILPDLDGRGRFAIDSLVYSEMDFTNVTGRVRIKDLVIECWDIEADVYTGKVSGTTTIDLNDFEQPKYDGSFEAKDIEANDFVSRFSNFGGMVYGKVNLTGTYDAAGWEPEDFLNALTVDGNADMNQGKLVTPDAMLGALSGLAEKAGKSIEKEQTLKNLASKIKVQDGKVMVDALKTSLGNIGDLTLDGFYGFNGDISYNGSLFLSESMTSELMNQSGVTSALGGLLGGKSATKRIKLPLTVSGTVDKPKVGIDLSEALKDGAKGQLEDALKGLLNK